MLLLGAPAPLAAENGSVLFSNPAAREAGEALRAPPQQLRILTVDQFQPFSFFDEQGRLTGVHVDLARALCTKLQVTGDCTIQSVPFDEIESRLISGQADAALAGIVPTAVNRRSLSFSIPYARLPARFLSNPNGKPGVGVVTGSVHEALAKAMFPSMTMTGFATAEAAQVALRTGSISRLFGDGLALGYYAASPASLNCCALEPGGYHLAALKPDALQVAVAAGNAALLVSVDRALRAIQLSGELDEMMLRHLPFSLND
ncbi:MAG: transporter substrate-binding domain-containing protein [Rhizobiaceae bacterium]|jgi:polar amino acid transport system substrate-binding protein|nr:transporter substrate-binding domain-containing protein [Rhizobiaceae bacterium]